MSRQSLLCKPAPKHSGERREQASKTERIESRSGLLLRLAVRHHGYPRRAISMALVMCCVLCQLQHRHPSLVAQVTMGYLIMLIAMTYQTELFMMVILGLTAGHAVFNLDGPVLESAEACCQGFDVPEETSSDQSGEAAGAYLDLPGSADTDEPRSCCARAPDTNGVPASGV
jgi:hypothetical protein